MRIALCVKQVPDVRDHFVLTEEAESLEGERFVQIANPADLTALALVRQVFPAGTAKMTAITIGPGSAERVLRACVALGADEAVRVWDTALERSMNEIEVIARVLAATISSIGDFDLIVCGSQGFSDASGFVGPALAEYLDLPQVCSVSNLESSPTGDCLTMFRRLDLGDREVVECALPAVITIDEGTMEIPYASFPDVLSSERIEIPVKDLASMGVSVSDIDSGRGGRLLRYVPPRPRTKRSPVPQKSLSLMEQMQALTSADAKKKAGNVVEGDPKKAAAEIVSFLESNGIFV